MPKKRRTPRSSDDLTALDDVLKRDEKPEELESVAIKEVLARPAQAMKGPNLSRRRLAERMRTG